MSFPPHLDTSISYIRYVDLIGNGSISERRIDNLFDVVAAAVAACADRLESLSISGTHHLSDIGHALSRLINRHPIHLTNSLSSFPPASPISLNPSGSADIPHPLNFPRLRTFSSTLFADNSLMPFLVSACREVRRWEISGLGARSCMKDIPPSLFPALEEFEGLSVNLKNVTHGRRVWNISIINRVDTQNGHAMREIVEGLEASMVPVLKFSINAAINSTPGGRLGDVELMREIGIVAPSLRHLEVFARGKDSEYGCSEEARQLLAQAVAVLTELEELHWWDWRGENWEAEFPKDCFSYSKQLQKVFINRKRYVRPQASTRLLSGSEDIIQLL